MHTIVIVEDDPGISQLVSTLLRFEGFETRQVRDWETLATALEQARPDLAIVDVHLQGGEGWELLRSLRSHSDPKIAATPVLMMSGMDFRLTWKQAGADGFLEKPFDRAGLLAAIKRVEDSRSAPGLA